MRLPVLLLSSLLLSLAPGFAATAVVSDDAYTSTAAAKAKLGAKPTLLVGTKETAFVRFDLSALPAGFPGDRIAKATLRLWLTKTTRAGAIKVLPVDGAWTEGALTGSAAPPVAAQEAGTFTLEAGQAKRYVSLDVTAL